MKRTRHYKEKIKGLHNGDWKLIPGFSSYEVSDLGQVRSNRTSGQPKILSQHIGKDGRVVYFKLMSDEKVSKYISISQCVATAFLDHTRCGHELVVDHIDNNPLNNRLDNLQVITHQENCIKDK
jgi:hypothetical protein